MGRILPRVSGRMLARKGSAWTNDSVGPFSHETAANRVEHLEHERHRIKVSIDNAASCSYIEPMKSAGLRELKNRLSEYVREVRSGEVVLVTDRGEVVAELIPPGQGRDEPGVPAGLTALARRGQVTLGTPNNPAVYPQLPRLLKRRRATELLNEERGTR
ncbi:MAG TPA: type II toxin-antitoxin system prevent-host-death family antitoxin [Terriglobia bacterium]|jgi:prevent-host-death family protein|nr:type II toxin-antitoxin system prevent-host-death family antitoxin [Terriglobia bacterium]